MWRWITPPCRLGTSSRGPGCRRMGTPVGVASRAGPDLGMLVEPFALLFGRVVPAVVIAGKHDLHLPCCLAAPSERIDAHLLRMRRAILFSNASGSDEVPGRYSWVMRHIEPLPIEQVLPALRDALRGGTGAVLQAPPGAGKTTGCRSRCWTSRGSPGRAS